MSIPLPPRVHGLSLGLSVLALTAVAGAQNASVDVHRTRPALESPDTAEAPKIPVTGRVQPLLAEVDRYMLDLMVRLQIPGAAVAVSHKGRLVYDRGFGYADVSKKLPVETKSRFRIASLSKPLTAVAVMQLIEKGKLGMDDKVFDLLRPAPFEGETMDPRFQQVTIRHLLQHRGGWTREASFDPMFRSHIVAAEAGHSRPAMPDDIIRYMAGKPLQFDPGEYYSYSNFGYCLLGRVIEKVSGRSYEKYVQRYVMRPVGIRGMDLGCSLLADRLEDEVRYYGQSHRRARSVFAPKAGLSVPWPYGGFHIEAMDSHGAWVASASDLLRFACDFDDASRSRLLETASVVAMFAVPPGDAGHIKIGEPRPRYYGCGWVVSEAGQEHGGSLPGTTTKLVRTRGGINWVVLFNTRRDGKGERIHHDDVKRGLQRLLRDVEKWPDVDLFRLRD